MDVICSYWCQVTAAGNFDDSRSIRAYTDTEIKYGIGVTFKKCELWLG
jgi:hypothetical protein